MFVAPSSVLQLRDLKIGGSDGGLGGEVVLDVGDAAMVGAN